MKPQTTADKTKERLKGNREVLMMKKENQINALTDEELINQLKQKALPVFGTRQEKLERLKKANGILPVIQQPPELQKKPSQNLTTVEKIQMMEKKREERRSKMEEAKRDKEEKMLENQINGKNVDVDFQELIKKNVFTSNTQQHTLSSNLKLCVCVRKRPLFDYEKEEIDNISVQNPLIRVLAPKYRVDGITKYVENYDFKFDNTFSENEDTTTVYNYSLKPLLEHIMNQGTITCFAYGQTGSGKTYTMKGLQDKFIRDLFQLTIDDLKSGKKKFCLQFFEIYGGKCFDLLNNKQQLAILEDKSGQIQINGVIELTEYTCEGMLKQIDYANTIRTTHATTSNDTSSRSHAICKLIIRNEKGQKQGQLILVDLAGSERAQDCQSNDKQRRLEGSEINKSLLALKECIRYMEAGASHIPFRASKLTMVLRDSFQQKHNKSKIIMIACVCPCHTSADHTVNTLRYADRLKEKSNQDILQELNPNNLNDMSLEQDYSSKNQDQIDFFNCNNLENNNFITGQFKNEVIDYEDENEGDDDDDINVRHEDQDLINKYQIQDDEKQILQKTQIFQQKIIQISDNECQNSSAKNPNQEIILNAYLDSQEVNINILTFNQFISLKKVNQSFRF